ncbi:hypothetical protein ROHU_001015 [Labeo rohita]|uniref:Uncharacterized protein n=1 Tax=Labeo rohita TaxID=84645 RepID=A0A498P4T6_LABRO|nr:hypothetical protein ROHU_037339 [Labeo rohita]RXN38544.1 hypothetical protein ROHU_001015 [Labeo rohita]
MAEECGFFSPVRIRFVGAGFRNGNVTNCGFTSLFLFGFAWECMLLLGYRLIHRSIKVNTFVSTDRRTSSTRLDKGFSFVHMRTSFCQEDSGLFGLDSVVSFGLHCFWFAALLDLRCTLVFSGPCLKAKHAIEALEEELRRKKEQLNPNANEYVPVNSMPGIQLEQLVSLHLKL